MSKLETCPFLIYIIDCYVLFNFITCICHGIKCSNLSELLERYCVILLFMKFPLVVLVLSGSAEVGKSVPKERLAWNQPR